MANKFKIIALVARNHGYEAIQQLQKLDSYEIIAIFTHKFNPKIYDLNKGIRIDFPKLEKFAQNNNILFYSIDSKEEKSILDNFAINNDFDFLVSISWRYIIPKLVFSKAKINSINIHRGDLPKYAGNEPIKQALENHEKEIIVSSHLINEKIDDGEILLKISHSVNYDESKSLDSNIVRLKNEITPIFPKITVNSLKMLQENRNS